MEKSINIKSEEFKNSIYNLINNSGLPVANVYYIFKMIFQQIDHQYYDVLQMEIKNLEQAATAQSNN